MARAFNGTSDFATGTSEATYDFERTNSFSIAVWGQWDGGTNAGGSIFNKWLDIGAGALRGYEVFYRAGGAGTQPQFAMAISNDTSTNLIVVRTTSSLGTGQHLLVATYAGTSLASGVTLYVDGSAVSMTTISDTLSATILNDEQLAFGCRAAAGPTFFAQATFAEIALWNVALSGSDVTNLYNGGNGVSAFTVQGSSLVGFWPFCGIASPEPDIKNGNAFTLTGTTPATHPINYGGCNQPNVPTFPRIRFSG